MTSPLTCLLPALAPLAGQAGALAGAAAAPALSQAAPALAPLAREAGAAAGREAAAPAPAVTAELVSGLGSAARVGFVASGLVAAVGLALWAAVSAQRARGSTT